MCARYAALAFLAALIAAGCSTQDRSSSAAQGADAQLLAWLQRNFGSGFPERDAAARYSLAMADLNSDGSSDALVYVSGDQWCGSGGCHFVALVREERGWREISTLSVTWTPIRLMETRSNGWRDIGVFVRGGGILPGYEALLQFDGRSYPANPTVPPARPAPPEARGTILIPRDTEGLPLFP
jgi:hypothetical protein